MKNKNSIKKAANSFYLRLSLKFTSLVAIVLITMFALVLLILNTLVRKQQGNELKNGIYILQESLLNQKTDFESFYVELPYYLTYSIYDENSEEVYFTNDPFLPKLADSKGKAKIYFEKNYFSDGDLNILYMSKNIDIPNDGNSDFKHFVVMTAINIDSDYSSKLIDVLPDFVVPFIFLIIIISFLISCSMTKKTIKPVVEITRKVKNITVKNLDMKLPVSKRNDEIDQLSSAFNELFTQIQKDFKREQQFSSDVSHELKTPLAVINGQTSLLLRWGKDNPEQLEKSLQAIKNETKYMQNIIEKLLQLSRYERGIIEVEKKEFSLSGFYNTLREEFSPVYEDSEVCITVECPEDLTIKTDQELLHQIFTVFISNSIKYSKVDLPCKIELSAELKNGELCLRESDNGPGIAEADLPKIFDRFYIGDKARTRKSNSSSSGLGLSIAKTLCQNIGAQIIAENNQDGGATMKVIFKN
ncbi:MAG: HAMP domain-containing sensor histidine kinase [Treponema sp.]|nr:HAMP domain-containing sensor histidine kinase [Treponema sp.]